MARILWGEYPAKSFEALLQSGSAQSLAQALTAVPATTDGYARLRLLDRLRELQPGNNDVLAGWIPAMLMSNRPAPVHEITSAWPMDHGPAPAWRLIAAQVAQTMGAYDEARARFKALLRAHPDLVDVWQKYIEFESADRLDPADVRHVQIMHEQSSDPYVQEKSAFALVTAWQRDDPTRAFGLAEKAHQLKRQRQGGWRSDELQQRLAVDRGLLPAPERAGPRPRPVFVVGLPRSGTTLLTRLLGSHTQVAGVGEQPLVPRWAAAVARQPGPAFQGTEFAQAWYRAALHDLAGGADLVVDKLPANAEHVGLILATFPDALVVWLERALPDCALSMYLHDFEGGFAYLDAAEDLAAYASLIRQHLQFWRAQAPGRVLYMRYEDLVADPAGALEPLLSASGLPWEPAMLDFWRQPEQTATYSEAQVRQPLNGRSIGTWRRFMPAAEGLMRTLGVVA